jgi:hypothetical protein
MKIQVYKNSDNMYVASGDDFDVAFESQEEAQAFVIKMLQALGKLGY